MRPVYSPTTTIVLPPETILPPPAINPIRIQQQPIARPHIGHQQGGIGGHLGPAATGATWTGPGLPPSSMRGNMWYSNQNNPFDYPAGQRDYHQDERPEEAQRDLGRVQMMSKDEALRHDLVNLSSYAIELGILLDGTSAVMIQQAQMGGARALVRAINQNGHNALLSLSPQKQQEEIQKIMTSSSSLARYFQNLASQNRNFRPILTSIQSIYNSCYEWLSTMGNERLEYDSGDIPGFQTLGVSDNIISNLIEGDNKNQAQDAGEILIATTRINASLKASLKKILSVRKETDKPFHDSLQRARILLEVKQTRENKLVPPSTENIIKAIKELSHSLINRIDEDAQAGLVNLLNLYAKVAIWNITKDISQNNDENFSYNVTSIVAILQTCISADGLSAKLSAFQLLMQKVAELASTATPWKGKELYTQYFNDFRSVVHSLKPYIENLRIRRERLAANQLPQGYGNNLRETTGQDATLVTQSIFSTPQKILNLVSEIRHRLQAVYTRRSKSAKTEQERTELKIINAALHKIAETKKSLETTPHLPEQRADMLLKASNSLLKLTLITEFKTENQALQNVIFNMNKSLAMSSLDVISSSKSYIHAWFSKYPNYNSIEQKFSDIEQKLSDIILLRTIDQQIPALIEVGTKITEAFDEAMRSFVTINDEYEKFKVTFEGYTRALKNIPIKAAALENPSASRFVATENDMLEFWNNTLSAIDEKIHQLQVYLPASEELVTNLNQIKDQLNNRFLSNETYPEYASVLNLLNDFTKNFNEDTVKSLNESQLLPSRIKYYKEKLADESKEASLTDEQTEYVNLIDKTLINLETSQSLKERKDDINNLNKYATELRQKLEWDDPLHILLQDIITNVSLIKPVDASIIKSEIHNLASNATTEFINIYKKEVEGIRNMIRDPRQNMEELVDFADQLNKLYKSVALLPQSDEKAQLAQNFSNNLKTLGLRVVNMYLEVAILRDNHDIAALARQINKGSTLGDMLHVIHHIKKELEDSIIGYSSERIHPHHLEEVLDYKRELGKLYSELHEGYRMLDENKNEKPLKETRSMLSIRSNNMDDVGRAYIHKISNSIFITLQQLSSVSGLNVDIIKAELDDILVELRYVADATNIPLAQIKHALNVTQKLSHLKEMLQGEKALILQPLINAVPAYLDQITFSIVETILRATKIMAEGKVEGEVYQRSVDIINRLAGSTRNLAQNIDSVAGTNKRFVNESLIKILLLEISILQKNVSSSTNWEVSSALQAIESTLQNLIKYTPKAPVLEAQSSNLIQVENPAQYLAQNSRIASVNDADQTRNQRAHHGQVDITAIHAEQQDAKSALSGKETSNDTQTSPSTPSKPKEIKQITHLLL